METAFNLFSALAGENTIATDKNQLTISKSSNPDTSGFYFPSQGEYYTKSSDLSDKSILLNNKNQQQGLLIANDAVMFVTDVRKEEVVFVVNEKDEMLFREIRNYLDSTFTHTHSLKSLARRFGINEFKLKKVFRTLFNCSVFSYIISKRMEHAQMLIREQRRPINEVASIIGYKNSNHFSTAFKKKFGVVPSSMMN